MLPRCIATLKLMKLLSISLILHIVWFFGCLNIFTPFHNIVVFLFSIIWSPFVISFSSLQCRCFDPSCTIRPIHMWISKIGNIQVSFGISLVLYFILLSLSPDHIQYSRRVFSFLFFQKISSSFVFWALWDLLVDVLQLIYLLGQLLVIAIFLSIISACWVVFHVIVGL